MKKNKLGLTALVLGAAGFIACIPSGDVGYVPSELLTQNTEFLVSLPGTLRSSGEDGIKNVQNNFFANLNSLIGRDNYTVVDSYDAINVLKIKANEAYKDVISSIDGVRQVSVNQVYRFDEVSAKQTAAQKEEGYIPFANNSAKVGETTADDNTNTSAESMHVTEVENNAGGAGSFVAILDTGYYLEHTYFANYEAGYAQDMAYARFNYTKLREVENRLNAKPIKHLTDEQAKDVNYQGENADGSLYYNLKIPFYYDYGASSENSNNDFDVLTRWSEHGNHVASITGANGTYDGIAPNAQLALMKVFYESIPQDTNTAGGVYAMDDDILEALEDCVVLGIDALNMSLGSDLDDFTNKSASMDVIDKLEADGINCNIAAGNAGKTMFSSMGVYKNWSVDSVDTGILGSYSNSTSANIVASSTNPTQYYETGIKFTANGKESIVAYDDQVDYTNGADGVTQDLEKLLEDVEKNEDGSVSLITAGIQNETGNFYGTAADYSAVQTATGNRNYFKGKIAVVDRGSNSFVDKATAAQDAGCAGLIVINNDPTAYEFTFGMSWASGDASQSYSIPEIPVVFVLYRDREVILDALSVPVREKTEDTTTLGDVVAYESPAGAATLIADQEEVNPNANELSDFSSEGATSRLDLIPTISAPGTSIRGAVLGEANSQGRVDELDPTAVGYLNGTSMATPNYTGIGALLVGQKQKEMWDNEHRLMTDEERFEYLRTTTMRTMSTADQYQSENDIVTGVTPEDTVTDDDYETPVTIYHPTYAQTDENGNSIPEVAPYSPRKQGAGIVNARDAVNSKVYLEGLVPNDQGEYGATEADREGNKFAKIELRNNEKIKKGTVKIGFRAHNESDQAVTYDVKVQVMTTLANKYHNHDNQLANYVQDDVKYEGAVMQTAYDHILETIELGSLKVNPNSSADFISADKVISEASKEYLAQYPNGNYLEGYVILTEKGSANGGIELTMPFMGFYGDYASAYATEPFEFEKGERYNISEGNTDGMIYGSDILNYMGENSYSRRYINTSSMIVGASYDDYQQFNRRAGVQVNSTNPTAFGQELTYIKDENGTTLYVGSDTTDVLYIQEFIYRSIQEERVEIIDEVGNTVLSTYMTDIINNTKNLYKSHVSSSYIADYSLAHRGYLELPLYTTDGNKIADGNYKIKFTYNLVYGSVQEKEFNLVIDSKAPALVSKTIIADASGNKTLRLKFKELYIPDQSKVHVNADTVNFTMTNVSDGYIIDIPLSAVTEDKVFINIGDATLNSAYIAINLSELETGLVLESDALTPGATYSYTRSKEGTGKANISERFTVSAKDFTGSELDLGTYSAYITFDKRVNAAVKAYGISESGQRIEQEVTKIDDTTVKVTTNYKTFVIEDNGRVNESISSDDSATVSFTENVEGGKVYVDKVNGNPGEVATIYAIPNEGYRVASVTVNGNAIAQDLYGNYQFVLEDGTNTVVVTFEKIA